MLKFVILVTEIELFRAAKNNGIKISSRYRHPGDNVKTKILVALRRG